MSQGVQKSLNQLAGTDGLGPQGAAVAAVTRADAMSSFGRAGDLVPQALYPLTSASRSLVAGRIILIRYVPAKPRTLTLAAFVTTVAASVNDPVEIGLYTSATPTLSRLATTGSTTGKLNALGVQSATLSYAVTPTVYYVALTNATIGGTGATVSAGSSDIYTAGLFGITPPNVSWGFIDSALSGGLLPATITSASVTWASATGQGTIPTIALRES